MSHKHNHSNLKPSQIEAWVNRHFPDNKPRKAGAEIRINNPFVADSKYHLNISTERAACNDWRGNEWVGINPKSGERNKCTFLRFVQLYLNCSYTDALKDVLGSSVSISEIRNQMYRHQQEDKEERKRNVSLGLPKKPKYIAGADDKISLALRRWLHKRGIDDRKIKKYKLMSKGFSVVWPYFEYDEVVYWQSRSITNKMFEFPKLDCGVEKSEFIYGFDYVEPSSSISITEAIIDAQTIEDQALASGGAVLQERQIRKIKALNPRDGIILAPDNDEAGLKSIISNAKALKPFGFPLYFSIPPAIKYVDSNGEEQVTKDWNDIGKLEGFDKVKTIMQDEIKPYTIKAFFHIQNMIDNLKRIQYVK